jgi:uncharacterized protein YceK
MRAVLLVAASLVLSGCEAVVVASNIYPAISATVAAERAKR